MITLKEVFDVYFANIKFDNKLAREIYNFQIGYINNNRDHLDFFGSNLLGVYTIRFKDSDLLKFYNTLDIDYYALLDDIKRVTTIDHSFKVAGDLLNLTIMYLLHRYFTSSLITDKQREQATTDIALIFFYRTIAALMSHYFKYPVDHKVAQMAYANLSNKYLIKKLGSWHKVMEYRAKDLINKKGLHYNNLVMFNNDDKVVYAISDSQGRLRDLMKNYYAEFIKVHENGDSIGTTSSTFLDGEGELAVKEKIGSIESMVVYLKQIITDRHSFIKDDLVTIINKINTNTSSRMIKHTLNWMVDNYNSSHNKLIDEFLSTTIVHSMHLIENNPELTNKRDYANILVSLKNLFLSTRSTDIDLIKIRNLGEEIVKKSNSGKLSNSLLLSTRTSIILYIVFRALLSKQK